MEQIIPPEWLIGSKTNLLKCQEWQDFQDELSASIDHQLTEGQLLHFTDLSEEGKRTLLQNALQSIHAGDRYAKVSERISDVLGEQIHFNMKYSVAPLKSPEWFKLQHEANRGLYHLLQKWPDLKHKLHRCFNIQLPMSLRQLVWGLYLENPKVKVKYLEKFRQNPEWTMSLLDLEIIKKCDHILQSEETLQPFKVFTKSLHLMKAVLSYYHLTMQTSSSIVASDYMLVIPFMYVTLATNPSTSSLKDVDTASTIEQFMTFMESRPVYMKESYTMGFEAGWTEFTNKVISRLKEIDQDLLGHVKDTLEKDFPANPADCFEEKMKTVIRPMVRSAFVGYLCLDTIMFVWDQYIIGLDSPNYDIIPVITALTISLLRLQIIECQTAEDIGSCLKRDGNRLKKEHYMYEINRTFYQDLISSLNGTSVGPNNYPTPWNVSSPGPEADDSVNRENLRLTHLLEKESRERQELEERSTAEIEEMKREISQLKKLIERDKDLKESRERPELEERSTAEIEEMKREISQLRKLIERDKDLKNPQNESDDLHKPSTACSAP